MAAPSVLVLQSLYVDADASMYEMMPTSTPAPHESPNGAAASATCAFPKMTRRALAVSHGVRGAAALLGEQIRGAASVSTAAATQRVVHLGLCAVYDAPLELTAPADARMAASRVTASMSPAAQQQQLQQPIVVPQNFIDGFEGAFGMRSAHDMRMDGGISIADCLADAVDKAAGLIGRDPREAVSVAVRVTVVSSRRPAPVVAPNLIQTAMARWRTAVGTSARKSLASVSVACLDLAADHRSASYTTESEFPVEVVVANSVADIGPLLLKSFSGALRAVRLRGKPSGRWPSCLIRHVRTLAPPDPPPSIPTIAPVAAGDAASSGSRTPGTPPAPATVLVSAALASAPRGASAADGRAVPSSPVAAGRVVAASPSSPLPPATSPSRPAVSTGVVSNSASTTGRHADPMSVVAATVVAPAEVVLHTHDAAIAIGASRHVTAPKLSGSAKGGEQNQVLLPHHLVSQTPERSNSGGATQTLRFRSSDSTSEAGDKSSPTPPPAVTVGASPAAAAPSARDPSVDPDDDGLLHAIGRVALGISDLSPHVDGDSLVLGSEPRRGRARNDIAEGDAPAVPAGCSPQSAADDGSPHQLRAVQARLRSAADAEASSRRTEDDVREGDADII